MDLPASESADAKALIVERGGVRRDIDDHTAVPRKGRGMIVSTTPLRRRAASGKNPTLAAGCGALAGRIMDDLSAAMSNAIFHNNKRLEVGFTMWRVRPNIKVV